MADTVLFNSILCPVDFSPHSRQALTYAAILAARSGGRLTVIFVEDPLLAAAASVRYRERALIDKARKELRAVVERTIAQYDVPWSRITLDVAVGSPHKVIDWTAAQMKCNLIVMGAHGWTGANKLMLGSTTHRVLRRSPLPVLATPPVEERAERVPKNWPGTVAIAPIDFGPRARADARAAAAVAKELGVRLELVHVVEPIADVPWLELDEFRRNQQRQRLALTRLTRIQDDIQWATIGVRVEAGKPADEIAAVAAEKHVGLVIMTRKRGQGLFGPRQGSISYEVLRKSKTPVLALPNDAKWMRQILRRLR